MLFVIRFLFSLINTIISIDAIVLSSKCLIKGVEAENGNYTMFLGIPYATVDENNPFGDSTPHPGCKTIFEAYHDTAVCPQYTNGMSTGTIHCLVLNIHVPNSSSSHNMLPVMVYIHGGTYVSGNGNRDTFDPKFLVKHDVIVVTINYRLGPYGFLCSSNPEYNNQGMKDQILAMRWVKDNIQAFGGDVSRITVFGQSAGAMALDLHLLTLNEDLFHRAIIQSGPALSPWAVTEEDDIVILRIAQSLCCTSDNVTKAIDCLSSKDPIEIINVANDLQITNLNGHPLTKPCVENNSIHAVLKDFPLNLQPNVRNMDIMIGFTNKEVMFMYPNENSEFYENYKFADEMNRDFKVVYDEEIVKQFYVGDATLNQDLQSEILDFGTDFVFVHPTERTVDRYLVNGANRVFRYVFAYEGGRNRMKISKNLTSEGASHGDDLGYLFDLNIFNEPPSAEDQKMIDLMTEMWTNFAKYGDPTPNTTALIPVLWSPVSVNEQPSMIINSPLTVQPRPFHTRMAFWELYYKLYYTNLKGYKTAN